MSGLITIEIKNFDKILSKFREVPRITTKELQHAIYKSIFLLQGATKAGSPVDKGKLRGSHETSFPEALTGRLAATRNYAIFVHDGTRYMRPRPWFKNAVESNKATVNRFFGDALKNIIAKSS